jgi:hypothetical protein
MLASRFGRWSVDSMILPILSDERTLDEAMGRMKTTACRGIVVRHGSGLTGDGFMAAAPGEFVLYMNRSVVGAWAAKERTCASLRAYEGEAVATLDLWAAPASPRPLAELMEGQLDQLEVDLGAVFLPRSEDDTMMIVTRSERKRLAISSAQLICACSGSSRHLAKSPPASEGGECDDCGCPYSRR